MAAPTPPVGGAPARLSAALGQPQGSVELAVGSQNVTERGLRAGLATWLVWTLTLGAVAYHFARNDDLLAWNSLGGALVLLGLIPAAAVTHLVSRAFERLWLVPRGLIAENELVIDFALGVHAAVLEVGRVSVLVIVQGENHVLLFARDARRALGGPEAWQRRWHQVSLEHLHHRSDGFGNELAAWTSYFKVRGKDLARIAGPVSDLRALEAIARATLAAAAHGDLLRVPLGPLAETTLHVTHAGVVCAFGEEIETSREFTKGYIWTWGKKNSSGDADALVLRQDTRALCLSMVERPGNWPPVGGVLPAAAEMPSPQLPREQQIHPLVFGALDALFSLQKQRLRHATAPDLGAVQSQSLNTAR